MFPDLKSIFLPLYSTVAFVLTGIVTLRITCSPLRSHSERMIPFTDLYSAFTQSDLLRNEVG